MKYFSLDKSYLITEENDEVIEIDGKKIMILPMYKYLLEV
jgi:hypothetical protein